MSGYGQFAHLYLQAGWAPLPLPHGAKTPVPTGWTGYEGAWPSFADVTDWQQQTPDANIALRLPKDVVGIDYDAYKADGVATMTELSARLGPLPATWRSSSRDDASGIYFYRLPQPFERLGDVGPGIETIRYGHRYAVTAPSTHPSGGIYRWFAPDGSSRAPRTDELGLLPDAWVAHLVERGEHKVKETGVAPAATYDALPDAEKARIDSFVKTSIDGIASDLAASASWAVGQTDSLGRGWEKLQADKAIRLASIALADWNPLTMAQAHDAFVAAAPVGGGWTHRDVEAKWDAQARRATPAGYPPDRQRVDLEAGLPRPAEPVPPQAVQNPVQTGVVVPAGLEPLDVSNAATTLEWLRRNLGSGRLSGIFLRGTDVVFTPRIGQEGYVAPRAGLKDESAASITVLDQSALAARVQARFYCTKVSEITGPDGKKSRITVPALFPVSAALHAVKAPDDIPALRALRGVIHAPGLRPDLSLIDQPGYDDATGLLFLPTGGQPTAAIPAAPSHENVAIARSWIDYMLQDFAFVSADDRANYIGLMLTPLLRAALPAPYKLGVIEAHQPGSGKTFLARALISIHSGLMHTELPSEEPELVKTVTSVLDTSTGAVVVFDNVTGVVRSSVLAGLLTNPVHQGRRLGTGTLVDVPNDRMWVMTGNNAVLAGDLARRSLRVRIDPGVPNPELRTKFAIEDFEGWVKEHRGDLLWALLTLVRNWVSLGAPLPDETRADSYGKWVAVIGAILECAGIPGTFDNPAVAGRDIDPETEEWGAFFARIYEVDGASPWTTKQLLAQVAPMGIDSIPGATVPPISYDALPGSLLERHSSPPAPATLARQLGRFLQIREGRWFGGYSVRALRAVEHNTKVWRIVKYGD